LNSKTPVVELRGISKQFAGVHAIENIDLSLEAGEIHGLVGENGAGKSTVGNVVSGVILPDAGELLIDGEAKSFRNPREALTSGIAMVAQEIALVPQLTVAENVFLGSESTRLRSVRAMEERFAELVSWTGIDLPARQKVSTLRLAEQQKVEILRALARQARVIVLDEPTAALGVDEARALFVVLQALKARGTTIVYVSHFLEEVLALVDRVTVMRDGRLVRTAVAAEETPATLVNSMLGRTNGLGFPPKQPPAPEAAVRLSLRGLSRQGAFHDVSLDVRAGEIVGLTGLVGSGRSEVLLSIFGALRPDEGQVLVDDRPLAASSPRQAVRRGVALIPESRRDQGLLMARSVTENASLAHLRRASAWGVLNRRRERTGVRSALEEVDLRAKSLRLPVSSLSGGNQQKVLFAKWRLRNPHIVLIDEPTRGVDVGAKAKIYEIVADMAREGAAILLVSSEFEEVAGLAHHAYVMRSGHIAGHVDSDELDGDHLGRLALGNEDDVRVANHG
jgi:simple sugar transport system ATP-binding protein/ribose transport system ATP-binding protein